MSDDHLCGYILEDGRPCNRRADWTVRRANDDPYDEVEACSAHVAEFLDPDYVNTVAWVSLRDTSA